MLWNQVEYAYYNQNFAVDILHQFLQSLNYKIFG